MTEFHWTIRETRYPGRPPEQKQQTAEQKPHRQVKTLTSIKKPLSPVAQFKSSCVFLLTVGQLRLAPLYFQTRSGRSKFLVLPSGVTDLPRQQ